MSGKKHKKPPAERRADDQQLVLGRRARDVVSGWTGVLAARYEYLNGCRRYEISGADDNGAPKGYVFDESQIEVLAGSPLVLTAPHESDAHMLAWGDHLLPESAAEGDTWLEPCDESPALEDLPAPGMAAGASPPMPSLPSLPRLGGPFGRLRRTGGPQSSTPVDRG